MRKLTKKISVSILVFAFGFVGCNPGIIDVPPPSVTDASVYFFPQNSQPVTFQDSSSATGGKFIPLILSFTTPDTANTFFIRENPGTTQADSISCTLGSDAVTISGISAHSIIPLPNGFSLKAKYRFVQEEVPTPISHVVTTLSGSVVATCDELGVFYSPDGKTWTAISLPFGAKNNRVTALTAQGKNVFAGTLSGSVYMSTNYGKDWVSKPILQFADSILTFASNPFSSTLYISVRDTVYKTETTGSISAKPYGGGNDGKLFTSLAFFVGNSIDSVLIGGTFGNGLWYKLRDGNWNSIISIPTTTNVNSLASTSIGVYCATRQTLFYSPNGSKWGQVPGLTFPYGILSYDDQRHTLIAANQLDSVIAINDTTLKPVPLASIPVKVLHDISASNFHSYAATDSGLYQLSTTNLDHWLRIFTPKTMRTVAKEFPGEIVLLRSRTGNSTIDSSWQADTLLTPSLPPFPITARIVGHLDQVRMNDSTTYNDVIEVRYSYEVAGQPAPSVPYWDIFFTKDKGPIIIYQISNSVKTRKIYRSR